MCFQAIYFATFNIFPESPLFLMSKNKFDEADKALQFYRNLRGRSNQKSECENELDRLINKREDRTENSKLTWKDFRKLLKLHDTKTLL